MKTQHQNLWGAVKTCRNYSFKCSYLKEKKVIAVNELIHKSSSFYILLDEDVEEVTAGFSNVLWLGMYFIYFCE